MKDLRTENYKTLLEELKEDIIKEKDSPGSWVERLTLSRRQYFPKLLIGSVQSLSKFQWCFFFYRNGKADPQIHRELQGL